MSPDAHALKDARPSWDTMAIELRVSLAKIMLLSMTWCHGQLNTIQNVRRYRTKWHSTSSVSVGNKCDRIVESDIQISLIILTCLVSTAVAMYISYQSMVIHANDHIP